MSEMSTAARSLFVFGIYLMILASILIIDPSRILSLFGEPPTEEVWIRVIGVVMLSISIYYLVSAQNELVPLIKASVPVRFSLIVFLGAFVSLGYLRARYMLFGVVDALGAMWTLAAIRSLK